MASLRAWPASLPPRFFVPALLACVLAISGCPGGETVDGGLDVPGDGARPDADLDDGGGSDVPAMDGAIDGGIDDAGPADTGMPGDAGDAGTDGGMPPTELIITICDGDALPSLPDAACESSAGDDRLLITADILAPHEVFRGGQVLIDATGHIACVGCDCSAGATGATTITCPDGVLSPGLINAHEHLTFQGLPYVDTGERYEHRHDWRRGLRGHTEIDAPGSASSARIAWAELRMVMGGATSINGSGSANGLLRNLDRATSMEDLGQPAVEYDTFPLGDSDGTLLTTGCSYGMVRTTADIADLDSYTPHLSEGIDRAARNEFVCVAPGGRSGSDLIEDQTAMIHGVGLTVFDVLTVREGGSMLIWSPRSNVTLYGDTARAPEYDRLGVPIALGTDWIYSGSMNMLRELTCADELNTDYFDGHFDDEALWLMATNNGAIATATDDVLGRIESGLVADLAIFDSRTHVDHRAVIDAEPEDVVLVLRGGRALYGVSDAVAAIDATGCEPIDVCGTERTACVMRETGMSLAALTTANASSYPLVPCGGTPMNEPSCHPERLVQPGLPSPVVSGSSVYDGMISAADGDGDGIGDDVDVCPAVFDPIRPLDRGVQPDFDRDGVGDACDPCPFDATGCELPSPTDRDADDVLDATDNCLGVYNPGQEDADGDLKGDLCDACPMDTNPGTAGCPATIYEVKDGTFETGQRVVVTGGIVTARVSNGFFMQVKEGDVGYDGADFSGVFVFTSTAPTPAVGNRVTVDGVIQDFFGQLQLSMSTVTITSSTAEALPAPIVAEAADVTTRGARARALESVRVRVEDTIVTAVNTTSNELTLDGALVVDDAVFLLTPFPTVGQRYLSITGVLALRNSASKLLVGSAEDAVGSLLGLGPALGFLRDGDVAAATIPTPVTVTLSRTSSTDTFVAVTSSDPTVATVVGGGVTIPAGATSAPILMDGIGVGATTLRATLGTEMLAAVVRVVGATEVPELIDISPETIVVPVGGSRLFRIVLDIPAPFDLLVDLAVTPALGATLPATVTIPADQVSATFAVTDIAEDVTLTATLGASMVAAEIQVTAGTGGLVINEIDYDQAMNPDAAEFIEIYNGAGGTVSLDGLSVFLVNGSTMPTPTSYMRVDLSGTLGAGEYLVISAPTLAATLPAGTRSILFPGTGATNLVQNGDPDGVILVRVASSEVIDAVTYGGAIDAAILTGIPGMFDVTEGTYTTVVRDMVAAPNGAIARLPDGADTDVTSADWAFTANGTPGEPNLP